MTTLGIGNPFPDPDELAENSLSLHDRRVRGWLERKLTVVLAPQVAQWTEEHRRVLVAWFMERPELVLAWKDADEYRGSGWSNGSWVVHEAAVTKLFPDALESVRRSVEATKFRTLDEWLGALAGGHLLSSGHREPEGASLVEDPEAFEEARKLRLARKLRTCRDCGASFSLAGVTDGRHLQRTRCPACIEREREAKECRTYGGEALGRLMELRGLTDEELRNRMTSSGAWLSWSRLRAWMGGRSAPRDSTTIQPLAAVLDVSPVFLWCAFQPETSWPEGERDQVWAWLGELGLTEPDEPEAPKGDQDGTSEAQEA